MSALVHKITTKIFGSANERLLKRLWPVVHEINALEPDMAQLSDDDLRARTAKFKEFIERNLAQAEITGDTAAEQKKSLRRAIDDALDEILVEAFAVVREASLRTTGMRHFDVQLIGGMVLHRGSIAEMKTGEGKTLVATLPVYLNALEGKGVHLITVNDYLATRDAEWMGRLYRWLGLSIGTIVHNQTDAEKRQSYKCDICYGQNNEFGFDYLRDNMKFSALEYAQRQLNFAIVDEVDSILIDEARTPLIISGPAEAASEKYRSVNEVLPKLRKDEHYNVDEKAFSVTLTDDGVELIQRLVGVSNLYDPSSIQTLHILNQLLRA